MIRKLVASVVAIGAVALGTHSLVLAAPADLTCTGPNNGVSAGNVNVPAGAQCILTNSTVHGDVTVGQNSYFEASRTTISGSVNATSALTVFLHDQTSTGAGVNLSQTKQLFLFSATVGGSVTAVNGAAPGYGHVQVCGSTIAGNVTVTAMGPDILLGDPKAANCPGNLVTSGSISVANNITTSELVVAGNTLRAGGVTITNNTGTSVKTVTGDTGTGALVCTGNAAPFTGSPNGTFASKQGQCVEAAGTTPGLPAAGAGPDAYRLATRH